MSESRSGYFGIYDKEAIKPRALLDFYPTPRVAVEALFQHVEFEGKIWEPASGNGAISRVFEEKGFDVYSSDIQKEGYGEGGVDFLKTNRKVDVIATNPPYRHLNAFLRHAMECATSKVVMLVNVHALYGIGRYQFFKETQSPSTVVVLSRGIPYFKGGEWHSSGGLKHVWIVFDKRVKVQQTSLVFATFTGKGVTDYDRELVKGFKCAEELTHVDDSMPTENSNIEAS